MPAPFPLDRYGSFSTRFRFMVPRSPYGLCRGLGLRGNPVSPTGQCRGCPRNCKRRAAVTSATDAKRVGKARQQHRPASQETCRECVTRPRAGCPGGRLQLRHLAGILSQAIASRPPVKVKARGLRMSVVAYDLDRNGRIIQLTRRPTIAPPKPIPQPRLPFAAPPPHRAPLPAPLAPPPSRPTSRSIADATRC